MRRGEGRGRRLWLLLLLMREVRVVLLGRASSLGDLQLYGVFARGRLDAAHTRSVWRGREVGGGSGCGGRVEVGGGVGSIILGQAQAHARRRRRHERPGAPPWLGHLASLPAAPMPAVGFGWDRRSVCVPNNGKNLFMPSRCRPSNALAIRQYSVLNRPVSSTADVGM